MGLFETIRGVTKTLVDVGVTTAETLGGNHSWEFRGDATVVFENNSEYQQFRKRFSDLNDGPLQMQTRHFNVHSVTASNGSRLLTPDVEEILVITEAKIFGIGAKTETLYSVAHDVPHDTLTLSSDNSTLLIHGKKEKIQLETTIDLAFRSGTSQSPPSARLGVYSHIDNHLYVAGALRTAERSIGDPHEHLQNEAEKIAQKLAKPAI